MVEIARAADEVDRVADGAGGEHPGGWRLRQSSPGKPAAEADIAGSSGSG